MGKRSNGCITCRKRKVKCDETKPLCMRCRKATYKCAGYDQPWFDETPYIALAHQRAAEREKEIRECQTAMLSYDALQALQSEGFLAAGRVAQPLNLSAFQDDICRSFYFHRLAIGPRYSKAMTWWLSPTPKAEVQSRTLVTASKAMAAAFFGRIHKQTSIRIEGDLMYGEALRSLKTDLSHPEKAFTFETLGATLALNMYEMVNLTAKTPGWITHAGGVGELIQVRGPELHKTYPEKSLFVECRMLLIANGIFSCRRTFLDDQKWKDVPWEDDRQAKTPFDYVVDVFSDIPFILQQVTQRSSYSSLPTAADPVFPADLSILQRQLLGHLETVLGLRETWHSKYSSPLWQIPPKTSSAANACHSNMEPPFETVLYFTDMYRANDFCIYNTVLILLVMLYDRVSHDLDPSLPYPTFALQARFPKTSLQTLVHDICRCTEFLLLDIHGSRGYVVFTLPATIAYYASDKESPEAKWLHDMCKGHADRSGFGFGEFALDRATPLSTWMDDCKKRCEQARFFSRGETERLTM